MHTDGENSRTTWLSVDNKETARMNQKKFYIIIVFVFLLVFLILNAINHLPFSLEDVESCIVSYSNLSNGTYFSFEFCPKDLRRLKKYFVMNRVLMHNTKDQIFMRAKIVCKNEQYTLFFLDTGNNLCIININNIYFKLSCTSNEIKNYIEKLHSDKLLSGTSER